VASGGNEIWLVEAVSGLETIEPWRLVAPSFFHNLSILSERYSGFRFAAATRSEPKSANPLGH
jgi:hypothetical protein